MTARLDLINSMLSTTGTAPLSAGDTTHPDYIDADGILTDILGEFTTQELWFNTETRTLAVDGAGEIIVPSNAISADPTDPHVHARIRGNKMWNITDRTYTYTADLKVKLLLNVTLDDMPPIAIQFVRAAARYEYFLDKDGAETKLKRYLAKLDRLQVVLAATNLTHLDVNFFHGRAAANFYTRRTVNLSGRIVR